MTPEMTFQRAQNALNLDPLIKEPINPQIANNWHGRKIASVVILGAASLLAAVAAAVAALFSLYVVAATCIAVCTLLTLSTIVVSQIKVSQKILGLIEKLTQTITSQFKQIQDLNQKIILFEEEPSIDITPEPVQVPLKGVEPEKSDEVKRQIEAIMSEHDQIQNKLEEELEANHEYQKLVDKVNADLNKCREELNKKEIELDQMQREKEVSQNITKEQQEANAKRGRELQQTVDQERKRIFELENELVVRQIQQEEAEQIKKELEKVKEENIILKEQFAKLAHKAHKDPLKEEEEIKELLPKAKVHLQETERLHRRLSLKPGELKPTSENHKKKLEDSNEIQQEKIDQAPKDPLKEEEIKEHLQKNQQATMNLWRRSLRNRPGEQSFEDIKKLLQAEKVKAPEEEVIEDIKNQPVDKIQKDLEKLKIELEETKILLKEKEEDVLDLKKQLAAKKIRIENKKIEELNKKVADLEVELKDAQDLLDKNTLAQKVRNQTKIIKQLETDKKEISTKLEGYQDDFVKSSDEVNKTRDKLNEQAKLIKHLKKENENLINIIEDCREDFKNFKATYEENHEIFTPPIIQKTIESILENMKKSGFLEKK